ncbi:MAG: hypothetical protein BAJALOKI3v1_120032 [Promethearchaeota archaeon]|jgi:hypothetical protein|nr:MAG: hypothetical protein BAJALOKI3v1_120032 [Candidatus Lokiarchaeota archaeon]
MIGSSPSKYEDNIAQLLDRSIILFRRVGNDELADKWDRILKNYHMSLREKRQG